MSGIPMSVWITLVVAVGIFVLATRRLINWPVVAGVVLLLVMLARCDVPEWSADLLGEVPQRSAGSVP